MRISRNMIHPELRRTAELIRFIWPSFTVRKYRLLKPVLKILRVLHTPKLRYKQKYITRPDGSKLRICIYTPLNPKQNVPGLLWIHGGGYALGLPEQDEIFIKRFIDANDCVVVSPEYTLSIDAPYPSAIEDCYTALLWLKEHGKEYGMRDDQIMVGGDSAGGGATAALTHLARDKKEVAIAFQIPLYPMLDDRMNTESVKDNDAPLWNYKSNEEAWRLYLGNLYNKPDIPVYAAPGRAENFAGLPPACSFVGSIEPFCDETVSYMNRLRENGIPVHFKVFDGCFHGFDIACGWTDIGKEAVSFVTETFKYAVGHYFAQQPDK